MKRQEDRLVGALALTFALACALRLIAVFVIRWQPAFDDAWYFRTATELAAGRGYLDAHGNPSAYFPIGYPATLSIGLRLFGSSFRAAQLVNVAFSLGTMGCVYALVRAVGGNARLALFASALFGFLPNQVISCCVTMSEITFTFALTLGILLSVQARWERSPWWGLLVGASFGWATLIRPQAILVPVVLVPLVVLVRHGREQFVRRVLTRGAFVALALVAVVGPWTYRNYGVFGKFVLVSSNGGENLLIGNNPDSTQHYTHPSHFYPKDRDVSAMPELQRDELGASMAKAYLRAHPLQAAVRAPKKVWYMYRSDLGVTNWIWDAYGQSGSAFYYLSQGLTEGCYLVILVAAFLWLAQKALTFKNDDEDRLLFGIVAWVVSYFTFVTLIFFGDARYHQPLVPLLAIAAAYFFRAQWARFEHTKRRAGTRLAKEQTARDER